MRLLNFSSPYKEPSSLETKRVFLRRPQGADFAAWQKLRGDSADFLKPFEPSWSHDELSKSAYRARLRRHESEITSGRGLPWFIFDKGEVGKLLGGITISNIRRGVAQTGTIGYWMGEPFAGQGYMSEALLAVCEDAFETHGLHRLEAATILDNERSQRLLLSCNFKKEGHARDYLKINGKWRDHYLYARLAKD